MILKKEALINYRGRFNGYLTEINNGRLKMHIIVGIAIVLIVFFSSSKIEKRLKSIENQNNRVIEILEEIRDKK